jgi:hypothetical protein
VAIQLQNVVADSLENNVFVTEVHFGDRDFQLQPGLFGGDLAPPAALLPRVMGRSVYAEFQEVREELAHRLLSYVHVPSERGDVQTVYDARRAQGWTVEETAYLLFTHPEVLSAVSSWMEKNLDGVTIRVDPSTFAFRLEARRGVWVNFAQSGRGIQSILPVVTLLSAVAMGACDATLIVIEEPEVHLHPSAQGGLADLIVAASSRAQVVVETHSENLLLRLRRHVAAQGSISHDQVSLQFVDDDAVVHEVHVAEDGGVADWPQGVFEYDLVEARDLVAAKLAALERREQ